MSETTVALEEIKEVINKHHKLLRTLIVEIETLNDENFSAALGPFKDIIYRCEMTKQKMCAMSFAEQAKQQQSRIIRPHAEVTPFHKQ